MRIHGERELRYTIQPTGFYTVGRLTLSEIGLLPDHSSLDSIESLRDGNILENSFP